MADVQFTISMDEKLKKKIQEMADVDLRSLSSQIEWIVKNWIDNYEK